MNGKYFFGISCKSKCKLSTLFLWSTIAKAFLGGSHSWYVSRPDFPNVLSVTLAGALDEIITETELRAGSPSVSRK